MAGQLGNVKRTTQSLEIVRVDTERQLLLIRGAVPGSRGGDVTVFPAIKAGAVGSGKAAKAGA
jgi:large subunit ribosomal protein L3